MTVVIGFANKTANSDKRNDKGNAVIGQHEPQNKAVIYASGFHGWL